METKLLKVRHISRPKFFFLDPLVFILKPAFLNVCGLHMKEEAKGLTQDALTSLPQAHNWNLFQRGSYFSPSFGQFAENYDEPCSLYINSNFT